MVRQGTLAFLILGLAACTQGVDDPANFTAGNSQGQSASSTSTGGEDTDSATGVATGNQDGTTTNSNTAPDDTTGGGATTAPGTTTTGPAGNCGNGIIDAGEQCDGADLQGFTCDSLGLSGGTLACDATMCTFDTSMCMSTSGTSG